MPSLINDLILVKFPYENFEITIILTKPILDGRKTFLTKRTCHAYLNFRPVEI